MWILCQEFLEGNLNFVIRDLKYSQVNNPSKNKANNNKELIDDIIKKIQNYACEMGINSHYLHFHLDRFPKNLDDVNEE